MHRKMFKHLPSKRINMWDLGDLMGPRNRSAFRPHVKRARRAEAREAMNVEERQGYWPDPGDDACAGCPECARPRAR